MSPDQIRIKAALHSALTLLREYDQKEQERGQQEASQLQLKRNKSVIAEILEALSALKTS